MKGKSVSLLSSLEQIYVKILFKYFLVVFIWQDEYGELTLKIENTATKPNLFQPVGEHAEFSKAQPTNHPTILKVHKNIIINN